MPLRLRYLIGVTADTRLETLARCGSREQIKRKPVDRRVSSRVCKMEEVEG